MLQLFKDGVELDPIVYSQERNKLGMNDKRNFVFYPNWKIGSRVFEIFERPYFKAITGYFGLSKTTIAILYKKLSDNIFDYVICKKIVKGMNY